jgi:pyrroloquinoline quinone biosynthesis protein B
LALLERFPGRRRVLIHINNTNPILREDSPERRRVEQAGVEVATDGLEIDL